MLKKTVIAGVRQVASWNNALTVAEALNSLGQNSGNMMFTESLSRVLENSTLTSFNPSKNELEGRDAIVLAAANWVNEFEDFGWLANVLEGTKLPVFLIGVGAQAPMTMKIPRVAPGTLRLLKIVAERSRSIAARGEFTCEVLAHYGIKNAVPTGCPSLLLVGNSGPKFSGPATTDRVVLHATRHAFNNTDTFQKYLYQQAMKQDLELLLQSEHADIYFALDRTNNSEILARASSAVRLAYETDDVEQVSAYLRNRGLFFIDFQKWISHMKTRTFCLGTRIHGTISSIIAGTPAVLIAHDSRTLEMAKSMSIPYVLSSCINTEEDLCVADYLAVSESSQFGDNYKSYFDRYIKFFQENELAVAKEW
jgi:hypothetical protein